MASSSNPYDQLSYPGSSFRITNPDHLAVLGTLYGMTPARPSRCRVLELGCSIGRNLMPMAARYPDSEFVGVDLSAVEIEEGKRNLERFGLRNVALHQADIRDIGKDWGHFDYIIAHGVYSWVPPAVRDKMLAIFKENLSPQGIAYVSYNAYPWSHFRDLVRDIMNFHTRDFSDPKQRIEQARAILRFVLDASKENTPYKAVLREQAERISKMSDEILYHDDLNEGAQAFLLQQVATDAASHGLQYLCDAVFERSDLSGHSDEVTALLTRFSEEQFLTRDQFLDFINGHGFRSTLLCHEAVTLRRKLSPECLSNFHLASSLTATGSAQEPDAPDALEFKSDSGAILATDHDLTKAALRELGNRWPAAISGADLIAHAVDAVPSVRDAAPARRAEEIEAMQRVLLAAVFGGHVIFYAEPQPMVAAAGERPEVQAFARKQAEHEALITNLRYTRVRLDDERVRRLLLLADGTRDIDRLVADLAAATRSRPAEANDEPIDRASVLKRLNELARMALLVR